MQKFGVRGILVGAAAVALSMAVAGVAGGDPISYTGTRLPTPSRADVGDQFGSAVAISGNTAVVLQRAGDDGFGGEDRFVYVYVRDAGGNWTEQQRLSAGFIYIYSGSDPVAISGDTIVIGSVTAGFVGKVHVFQRSGPTDTTWEEQLPVLMSDAPASGDSFGETVAIDGNTLVVGAAAYPPPSAIHVFERTGPAEPFAHKQKLVDPGLGGAFGSSVAVSGDRIVTGAYAYVRSGESWSEPQTPKPLAGSQTPDDGFGNAVGVSGDTIVVGAPEAGADFSSRGAAHVFVWNGADWVEEQRLTAQDSAEGDRFGRSVAISGETLVVGSPSGYTESPHPGRAYVFARTLDTPPWQECARLTATGATSPGLFGDDVAIDGGRVLVGAPGGEGSSTAGAAYVFETGTGPPPPPPPPPSLVESFVLPQAVVAKVSAAKPFLRAAGFFDLGPDGVALGGPATFDIGPLTFSGDLTPNRSGRRFVFKDGKLKLLIVPSRAGSSRAKFKLLLRDDLEGPIDPDGSLTLRFRNADVDGVGIVELDAGKYKLGRKRGALRAPGIFPYKGLAKFGNTDSLVLLVGMATTGDPPASAPDVTIGFGATYSATVPSTAFTETRPGVFTAKNPAAAPGVRKLVVDHVRERIVFVVKGVELGPAPLGAEPVTIFVRLGGDERTVRVRISPKGAILKY